MVVTHATTLDKNVHLTVREDQNGNFFWDAQIKESPQHAAPATNPGDTGAKAEQSAFEDSISLEKKEVNKSYYQSAFAGSRVDYDEPSLEAIGSGEGAHVQEKAPHATPATNPWDTVVKAEQSACQSRNVIFLFWYDKMINLSCL